MIWNHASALAGLVLVALPVAVHLLIRHHAARVVFPAMRFVPPVRAAAVRLRAPSDRALLILRIAIVAAAALAAAQPLLTTPARERAWRSRVARAAVVDTSPSVAADVAARFADRAAAGAFVSRRFASPDLRDALRRATEWLETVPSPRREIAIVGDFQRGSLDEGDLAAVPKTIGISATRAGRSTIAAAGGTIDGWKDARWNVSANLQPTSTQATWSRTGKPSPAGLAVRSGPSDRRAAERAAYAARSAGVTAAVSRPIEVSFAGADVVPDGPMTTPWIVSAAMRLHASPLLADTNADIQTAERRGVLIVKTTMPATSRLAPAVIRAALMAVSPPVIDPEAEPASMDDATLRRWVRDAAPASAGRPPADETDGRWLWMAVLALLGVESLVRSRGGRMRDREARADAA